MNDSSANGPLDRAHGGLDGAQPDRPSTTADWRLLQPPIDGVQVVEVRHVPTDNGFVTEVWRDDWGVAGAVGQVFQNTLEPGRVSAWHVHREATDRLYCTLGLIKIVLFDAREGSSTHGRINVYRCGTIRPMLVVVPPGVWHGVQNLGSTPSLLLNLTDRPYRYDGPDHWRLPADTDAIPYRFDVVRPNSDDPSL